MDLEVADESTDFLAQQLDLLILSLLTKEIFASFVFEETNISVQYHHLPR